MARNARRDRVIAECNAKAGSTEEYPFGDEVAVFKIGGRIFALVSLYDTPGGISLKCDPDLAIELRDRYTAVRPGYHLNKTHWNTVELDGTVPRDELSEMIDHSYDLVFARLTRAQRENL